MIDYSSRDFESFKAGWIAAMRSPSVNPGEGFPNMSPNTSEKAWGRWQLTCREGHISTFVYKRCKACKEVQDYWRKRLEAERPIPF